MFRNTMKTTVLLASLGGLMIAVGGLIGGQGGLVIGLVLGFALVGASYWFSDRLALRAAGAQVVTEADAPNLHRMVYGLTQRAGLPMPTLAVSPSMQPNAFATGRGPRKAVVCVTQGLVHALDTDELEGVLAHELMHVKHRDILIGSVAAAIGQAISFVANMAMFSAMFGGGDDDDSPNPIVLLALSILAPMAAMLIQFAVSRSREFEADRGAAELIGAGEPLARALEKIEALAHRTPMAINPAQASAWIHNPLAEAHGRQGVRMAKLFSTHPDTGERIRRLRAMSFAG